ncbi:MAG: BspA family leucine-rich repeat surface protein [Bacteroidales bacterium]|nr:BspA family leucine-rich repeat surface protein [Bacteroidales bacterium]
MEIVSYAMGEGAGYDEGYTGGYNEGYTAGEASSTAYQDGYNAGETAGYNSGYSAGYTAGAASVNSVKALLDYTKSTQQLFYYYTGGPELITDAQLLNLIKYDDTENVTHMENMFACQGLLTSVPLLNTGKVTNMNSMFAGTTVLAPPFNNGGTPPLFDTSKVKSIQSMFDAPGAKNNPTTRSNNMTALPLYDFSSVTTCAYFLRGCKSLRSVPALNFSSLPVTSGDFANTEWAKYSGIIEIHIVDIHYNFNISFHNSFTREALVEIIGNLRDMTGSAAKTLTMGATNMAKLTEDDIAVATDKNWTVA